MLIAYYTNKTRTIETKKSIGIEVSHFDKKELVWIPKSIITENTLKWSESNGTLIILEISNYWCKNSHVFTQDSIDIKLYMGYHTWFQYPVWRAENEKLSLRLVKYEY